MACFFCRRRDAERVRKRVRKFTSKEIEPFVTVRRRVDGSYRGAVVAVLGAALLKEDGKWETYELTDEMDGAWGRHGSLPSDTEIGKAVGQMKRRLRDALNRLREHYEQVYIYSIGV